MSKQFSVLEIKKKPQTDELEVKVSVNQEERMFVVKFEGFGASIPGELQNLAMDYLERTKDFYNLLFAVYEGENVELPVNLKCWEKT